MKQILLILIVIFAQNIFAQTENVSAVKSNIIDAKELEVKPDFPGGLSMFYQFIGRNFNVPERGENFGKIFVSFIVETDGTLSNISIMRGINPKMNQEAIRVMKLSPNWNPGKIGDKAVRVQYSIPISIN